MGVKGELLDTIGPYSHIPADNPDKETRLIQRAIIEQTSFFEHLATAAERPSAEDVIKMLHQASVIGAVNERGELVQGGVYRNEEVGFGSFIAVEHTDVPALMEAFSRKIYELASSGLDDLETTNLLATWQHLTLIAIHPFEDGNGRTARSLIEYLRYSRCRALGIDYEPLVLPRGVDFDQTIGGTIDSFYLTRFLPPEFADMYSRSMGDLRAFYSEINVAQRRDEFFDRLRDRIMLEINVVSSIDDLRDRTEVVDLSRKLAHVDSWTIGRETISLKAQEIVERAKHIFG